jgi:hypothetical protein
MSEIEITLKLPSELVERARAVGVQLEAQIRRLEAARRLQEIAEQLQSLPPELKPTPEEIEGEIRDYRTEKAKPSPKLH